MHQYDLVIVGGGLVGAGLAVALHQSEMKLALIDAKLPHSDDPRLFGLNASSCQFLKNVGVWSQLMQHAAPIHRVHVSHQGHFGAVRLNREEVPAESLGHVIPAHYIEAALNDLLAMQSNITVYRPALVETLIHENEKVVLTIKADDGVTTIQANWVVGADGAQSIVREQANIPTHIVDYEQSALVTRTLLARSHQYSAYERFTNDGAIAMLPLVGNECATIWTASHTTIQQLMALDDQHFLQKLQNDFGYRLGRLEKIKKRHVFPLRLVRAEQGFSQNVLLLGNAAHTLHPIAAQGFNLALYEVAALVEGILNKADLVSVMNNAQKQQKASIGVSHYLPQIFSRQSRWLSALAQLGMIGLDITKPLKKKFMNSMMGRTGIVPSLLLDANE